MSNSLFLISLLVDLIQVSLPPPPPQHLLSICFWHKWVQYTRKCLWKKSLHSLCLVYLVNTVIPYISVFLLASIFHYIRENIKVVKMAFDLVNLTHSCKSRIFKLSCGFCEKLNRIDSVDDFRVKCVEKSWHVNILIYSRLEILCNRWYNGTAFLLSVLQITQLCKHLTL